MNTYIKTIISLIILTLAVAGIEAQTVNSQLIIDEGELYANSINQNHVILAFDDKSNNQNDVVKIVNLTNNNIRSYTLEPNVTGQNIGVRTFIVAISDNGIGYSFLEYKTRPDNVVEMRIDKLNLDGTSETILSFGGGGPLAAKCFNGKLYFQLSCSNYGFDPESSGLPNINSGEYLFVAMEMSTNNILWTNIMTEGILKIETTTDNNLFVTTNNGYKKINAADGSLMVDTPVSYNIHEGLITYDEIRDNAIYIDNANHENYGKEIDAAGTEIIHTGFDPFNNYGLEIWKVKNGTTHDYFLANKGIGQLIKLDKSESVQKQYLVMNRSYATKMLPSGFTISDYLEVRENGFLAIAKNTDVVTHNFFGTSVPSMNYVLYELTVDTNPGVFISLNDISGTHNVIQVIENSVMLPNGSFESSDIKVGYCIMNNTSNIPAVGADVSGWGLFHMNGGLQFLATHPVKENANGRYIDGIAYIPDGSNHAEDHNYFNYRVYFVHLTDNTPPVAITQPYTAQLDANGQASLSFANIDNGSYDNFGTYTVVAFSPTTVNCADVGNLTVSYTLEDATGNQTNGTETVVINDNTAPNAPANLSIGTITETSVVVSSNGASDNCSIDHYEFYIDTNIDGLANGTLVNATATTPNYTYTGLTSGTTYEFYNKAVDASGNTSDAGNVVQTTTVGINDEKIAGLRMYPNPATNTLNIEIDGALNHIEIFNLQGQLIRKFDTQAMSKYQINVSRLTKGVYPIHIWDKNGMQVVRKLVVK